MAAKLKVTQVKSTISHIARNRATVRALGLNGIGSTSTVTDDDDRAEAEATAALDDLRDAIDLDDALLERKLVGIDPCHVSSS